MNRAAGELSFVGGRRPLDEALADYQSRRDERSRPLYEFTCELAKLEPPPPMMRQLFAALRDNQAGTNQFFAALTGSIPLPAFMDPTTLGGSSQVRGLRVRWDRGISSRQATKLISAVSHDGVHCHPSIQRWVAPGNSRAAKEVNAMEQSRRRLKTELSKPGPDTATMISEQNPSATLANIPFTDAIARRAYERFQARGGEHGHDWEDWFEAERELRGSSLREAIEQPLDKESPYAVA